MTLCVPYHASFRPVYERYGVLLHYEAASLSENVVEQDADRDFSFLIRHIVGMRKVLANARVTAPKYEPGVHVNYQETVLRIKDGLTKLKDVPEEMGGSGASIEE